MHITLVLPVYNEEKNIRKVITSVKKIVHRIIVIDNNSSDNTRKLIKKPQLNRGFFIFITFI
jgi:glycosyltransferase involved in cell wall biosynthesis